jgi:AraC-like DNA-binding protein
MKLNSLKKLFNKFKVLTLSQVSKTHGCSIRTAQRQFAELAVLRSYNKNSRYYTLPEIPKFNVHGIWSYRDIFFSKYGDLRQTVKHMILASEDGLSGNEIGDIVNLLPRSFMHHFRDVEGVFREKHGGVYIYFSNAPTIYARQIIKRVQADDVKRISDAIAIKILVVYIKHPELSEEELSSILRREQNLEISPSMITNLLSFHGLLKKTLDSGR